MQRPVRQEFLAVGKIQDDVDQFLRSRGEGFDAFFASVYKATLLTAVAQIEELNETPPDPTPRPSVAPDAKTETEADGKVRFRDKWKAEGKTSVAGSTASAAALLRRSLATPVPALDVEDGQTTPPSKGRRSFAFSQATWGDRFRSMTPIDSPVFRPMVAPEKLLEETEKQTAPLEGTGEGAETVPVVEMGTSPIGSRFAEEPLQETAKATETQSMSPKAEQSPVASISEKEPSIEGGITPRSGSEDIVMEPETAVLEQSAAIRAEQEAALPTSVNVKDVAVTSGLSKPVSTIQKMKNLVTIMDHAPAHLLDTNCKDPVVDAVPSPQPPAKEENLTQPLRTFVEATKKGHAIASGQNKPVVPALKKGLALAEASRKREAERQKQKDEKLKEPKLKDQKLPWRTHKKTLPVKAASKPDAAQNQQKRMAIVKPSPNKKQRLDPEKKTVQGNSRPVKSDNITPSPSPGPIAGGGTVPTVSPPYDMTPAGLLATDTRTKRRERRKEKHVPSWADQMALQNSKLLQDRTKNSKSFPLYMIVDQTRVFGTPDPMVVRDAAERMSQYKTRAPSSAAWSDEDEETELD